MSVFVSLIAGILLASAHAVAVLYAPDDALIGAVQKIVYIHIPCSWWSLFSFFLVCACSIGWLITKHKQWDILAAAAAEIGLLFNTGSLLTGMLWGRYSWGVWWTWDPRLTTALVLWFLYAGYLLFRQTDISDSRRANLSAVLGILFCLDVPLVFFSARIWRSIHPAVFAAEQGGMEPEMLHTVIICLCASGLYWAVLLFGRYRFAVLR